MEGAFQRIEGVNQTQITASQDSGPYNQSIIFNASLSSSVYQDGAKVQGDNARARIFVVVANSYQDTSVVDWSAYITSLNNKANTDLSNVLENIDYVMESGQSEDGSQWYKKWKSGYIEQGGKTLIPANTILANQTQIVDISFIKSFTTGSHNIICNPQSWAGSVILQAHNPNGSTSSFTLYGRSLSGNTVNEPVYAIWTAFGY